MSLTDDRTPDPQLAVPLPDGVLTAFYLARPEPTPRGRHRMRVATRARLILRPGQPRPTGPMRRLLARIGVTA